MSCCKYLNISFSYSICSFYPKINRYEEENNVYRKWAVNN